jgi:hypothetical protein
MHLKQMVKRCPSARYLGVANLPGYRWQINERGYANIVEASAETQEFNYSAGPLLSHRRR